MLKKTINNFNDLDKWLSDNDYFEDGHVISVKDNPLEIIVGYNVKANYKAYSERHILSFKLTPTKVIEWTFDRTIVNTGDSSYIEGIEPIQTENGICIEFSTPVIFRLTTDILSIEEQDLIKTIFKPWVSDKEMFLTSDLIEIPRPEFWKNKLEKFGHNILFRYYSGDERQPEQVPYPDYQGYYIQLSDRISTTEEGIFLKSLKIENGKLRIGFENKDEKLKEVWNDLTMILSDFSHAIINSGNCEFTGTQWKQYLKNRTLPNVE